MNSPFYALTMTRRAFAAGFSFLLAFSLFAEDASDALVDSTSELRARCERLKSGETMRLDANRVYHLFPTAAKEIALAPAGSGKGVKRVALQLAGLRDVTVDGNGATLVIHPGTSPFVALACTNVAVRNLNIAASALPLKEATLLAKDDTGFTVKFEEAGPKHFVKDGMLTFVNESEVYRLQDAKISLHGFGYANIHYLFCGYEGTENEKDALASTFYSALAEDRGNGVVHFRRRENSHAKSLSELPYDLGERFGFLLAEQRTVTQMFFEDCENVLVEDVHIQSGVGMGCVAQMCRNVTLRRYRVAPLPGRSVSTTADTMYMTDCEGNLLFENCESAWALDDTIDVNGNYVKLETAEGRRGTVRVWHRGRYGFFPWRVGESVNVVDGFGAGRKVLGTMKVVAYVRPKYDSPTAEVGFDRDVPAAWVGKRLENAGRRPNVVFRGCNFHDYFHLRLSAGGDFLMENNRFENGQSAALVVDLLDYWGERGPVRNFAFVNNDVGKMRCCALDFQTPFTGRAVVRGNRIADQTPNKVLNLGEGVKIETDIR